MEKVKLPRNVADAFNAVFLSGDPVESAFRQIIRLNEYQCCTKDAKVVFDYFNEKGFLLLAKAITDGYEVEQEPITVTITPEQQEKVRGLYENAKQQKEVYAKKGFLSGEEYWRGNRQGIRDALDALGIEVMGVNA